MTLPDIRPFLKENERGGPRAKQWRQFEGLPIYETGWALSAQNSPYHYVTGRWELPYELLPASECEDFEIAVFAPGSPHMVSADRYPGLMRSLQLLLGPGDGPVFGHVPWDKLPAVIEIVAAYAREHP